MKKYYTIALYAISVLGTCQSFAQPKIVATLGFWGTKDGGGLLRMDLPGTTPGVVHSFDNTSPHWPTGGVIAGDNNWLYGISNLGGVNKSGTLYKIRQDGTSLTSLYNLGVNAGSRPIPFYHTDGMVYFGDNAAIGKYNTGSGSVNFFSIPGNIESRNLYIDSDDWIYYVEQDFPSRLVRVQTNGTSWTALHTFDATTEGNVGLAGVIEIPGDSLLGVLRNGGLNDAGAIYSVLKDGTGFAIQHQFSAATGIHPESKLVYFDGKLYGTTSAGGDFDKGVLFSINSDGSNYRVLYHFTNGDGTWPQVPFGNISIASNGRIFGAFLDFTFTTDYFYLYKIDTSGQNFEPFFNGDAFRQHVNGEFSQDPLLINDATIFFTTSQFGRNDGGTLNTSDTSGAGSSLYEFGVSPGGFRPISGLIKASDGKIYGTTNIGGPDGDGVIFSMNPDGTGYTVLHVLTDAEGFQPSGKLLEASDGKLYGACRYGGPNLSGTLFRLNKNGTGFQVIYGFITYTGAYSPVGSLIEDNNGVLFGSNFWPYGSVFKINKDGSGYTELKVMNQGTDPNFIYDGLKLSGGYLYGAGGYGGPGNTGAIFRIRPDGTGYQLLHQFDATTEGELPVGSPLIASNGKIYGTTAFGGTNGSGHIFRIDTTGANFTVLKELDSNDGDYPWADLIQASDGIIYGGTQTGGTGGAGTIFKINLDGSGFTVIKSLDMDNEGQGVYSLLDLNGNFALPVELISFTAERKDQTSLLKWKTAQEQNSDRFEIERSSNGIQFHQIGVTAATGNTNSITNYLYTDNNPFPGVDYYRLKQLDRDGSYTYSKIVSINFDGIGKPEIFPNPAADRLYIRLPQGNDYTAVRIMDASGKLIMQENITSAVTRLNVQALPKGWYVIQLIGKDKMEKVFLKE